MSSSFRFLIVEYVEALNNVNCLLQLGKLTWIEYMLKLEIIQQIEEIQVTE